MAKISKIRFINLTYNDNRHIYDETFDFYNGENTLMNFQNGGGKTVLVQMMMQPIVPKQRLKDRIFKSYFKNIKAPVYIMIEWILDKSNKKVTTGIGVKRVFGRNQDEDRENIRIITFMSEYEKESEFDIKNINLLEDNIGIVKLVEFDKVIKNISEAEKEGKNIRIFRWELPEDKREYVKKLSQYRINQLEWKNLMVKINEAEAGLNSFFDDCKTNKNLLKKWFIPTIEEQLNREGSMIENLKDIIKNHAEQIVKNESMIKEKEIFEGFKNSTIELVAKLEEYKVLIEDIEKKEFDLGNLNVYLVRELKEIENIKVELINKVREIEASIRELDYEKKSFEFHTVNDNLLKMNELLKKSEEEIDEVTQKIKKVLKDKNILFCAKLKDEIKGLDNQIVKFETELEMENLKQEDVKLKLNDIEYSLKVKYKDLIERDENLLNEYNLKLSEEKKIHEESIKKSDKLTKDIDKLMNDIANLKGKLSHFEESERRIKRRYSDFYLDRNISSLKYSDEEVINFKEKLKNDEEIIYLSVKKAKSDIDDKKNNLNKLRVELDKIKIKNEKNIFENNKNKNLLVGYEEEKEIILKIIKRNNLKEVDIFNKDKIVRVLNSEIDKYKKLISEKILDNSNLKNQLDVYMSGKTIELSNDLKKIFEDNNIFVDFGYEWLRNFSKNHNTRIKMLNNNPFLPYSIIISREDLKELKTRNIDTFTSSAVPILVKENLEEGVVVKEENNIYSVDNINFLMSFNEKLLNKNYLKELTDDINSKVEKNKEIINNAQDSVKNLELDMLKFENFDYKENYIESVVKKLKLSEEKVVKNLNKIRNMEDEINKENESKDKLIEMLRNVEKQRDSLKTKTEDIYEHFSLYKRYLENLDLKNLKEENVNNYKEEREEIENLKSEKIEKINMLDSNIKFVSNNISRSKREYIKYKDVNLGNFIDSDIENLKSKRNTFMSSMGNKIQDLNSILEDYRMRKEDKSKEIRKFNIDNNEYDNIEFSEFEFERLSERIEFLEINKEKILEKRNNLKFKIAGLNSDKNHILKTIKESFDYDSAKSKEYLRDINYNEKRMEYLAVLKETSKEQRSFKSEEKLLKDIRVRVEEYDCFMEKVEFVEKIRTDNIDIFAKESVRDYRKLMIKKNDLKALLVTLYGNVENDFAEKAEVFKNLFRNILEGDKKYESTHALNAFSRTYLQIERKLEQHSIDIRKIDEMEKCIIDNTLGYLRNIYDELNNIDKNSKIEIEGKSRKMLMINLPDKDKLDKLPLNSYLKNTIDNCVKLHKEGKSMEGLLLNEINTFDLFDRFIGISNVEIILLKIELNKVKKKTWKQVISENSGGERFVSAFVVFISLLTYMRGESMVGFNNDTKVLIMDNPFGPITSEHLLKPLFEIAKKYNTQLICLTDLKEHTIFDRFNLIYSINIEKEIGRDEEYIEIKTIKKELEHEDTEDEIVSVSMFKIEQKSRFHLEN